MTTTKPQSTTETLEPCPFCGAAPNLKQVPSKTQSANYWWIGCEIKGTPEKDLIGCGIGHSAWSKDEVIAKWNTRISPASTAPVVDEALRKFLESYQEPCLGDCEHDMCPLLRQLHALRISATLDRIDREQAAWAAHRAVLKHECVNPARTANVASDAYYAVMSTPAAATAAPVEQSDDYISAIAKVIEKVESRRDYYVAQAKCDAEDGNKAFAHYYTVAQNIANEIIDDLRSQSLSNATTKEHADVTDDETDRR